MTMAIETHAVFASKADAEKYQALKDKAAGLPAMQGQPGGDDPTGRRHLYPAQTLCTSLESVVEAADKTAFAVTLDPKIDPGAKAVKGTLTDATWKPKPIAIDAAPIDAMPADKIPAVVVKGEP
jgi:hypothetical protein